MIFIHTATYESSRAGAGGLPSTLPQHIGPVSQFETRLVLGDDENDKPFLFNPFEAVPIAQNLLGIVILVGLAWLLGEGRLSVPLKHRLIVIGSGLSVQLVLALLLLKLPATQEVFLWLNGAVVALQEATAAGTSFVFGYLGGGTLPFEETKPGASFVLTFRALPLILVIGALSSLLFYWRVLPVIVGAVSWCLQKVMGIGGALGVGAAANVFVGMVEAPLLIRPYLARLTRSELFAVMVCGMATIAGTMMVLYATVLEGVVPHAIGHLLTVVADQCACGHHVGAADGAENRATHRRHVGPGPATGERHGCHYPQHHRRRRTLDQRDRHVGGSGRPGASGQFGFGTTPRLGRRASHVTKAVGCGPGAACLAYRHSLVGGSRRRGIAWHQDHPQRIHRLFGFRRPVDRDV